MKVTNRKLRHDHSHVAILGYVAYYYKNMLYFAREYCYSQELVKVYLELYYKLSKTRRRAFYVIIITLHTTIIPYIKGLS